MKPRVLAIIPARGGSKGLPGKNLAMLGGQPLIVHSIQAAEQSDIFESIVVSTDDPGITRVSSEYNAEVLPRPKRLASDTASSLGVIRHTLEELAQHSRCFDTLCLLQPTSPLRTEVHIHEAFNQMLRDNALTCTSIVECKDHPLKTFTRDAQSNDLIPMKEWGSLCASRQTLPKYFRPNGAIYFATRDFFLEHNLLLDEKTSCYLMDGRASIDVDTQADLELARFYWGQSIAPDV